MIHRSKCKTHPFFWFFWLSNCIGIKMVFYKVPWYSSNLLTAAFLLAAIACTFAANHGCRFIDVKVLGSAFSFSRGIWKVRMTDDNTGWITCFLPPNDHLIALSYCIVFQKIKNHHPNQGQFGPAYRCWSYNPKYYEIDTAWKLARAVSIIADLMAVLAFVLTVGSLFDLVRNHRKNFQLLSVVALCGFFSEALTMLFFNTQLCTNQASRYLYICTLGTYSKLAISAAGLWLVGAVSSIYSAGAI